MPAPSMHRTRMSFAQRVLTAGLLCPLVLTAVLMVIRARTVARPVLPPIPENLDGAPVTTWLPRPMTIVDTTAAAAAPLASALRRSGLGVDVTPTAHLGSDATLGSSAAVWITNRAAAVLPLERIEHLLDAGTPVLLDGDSAVARSLLRLQPEGVPERVLVDHGVEVMLDASTSALVPRGEFTTLARTRLGVPALVRSGLVLWSSVRLDEGRALTRLPYLASTLEEQFGMQPTAERNDIDLYVDPDLLGAATPRDLAQRWSSLGIRRLYLAAWKDDRESNGRFAYTSFIETMHRRGIEVYAWLEWPHVNRSFWNLHPECRERTADGGYARVYWREHVALELPHCFELAWAETKDVLTSAPFDGVNLAELYFEGAPKGPDDPTTYTPFHPELQARFRASHAFSPSALFDPSSPWFWKSNPTAFAQWTAFRDGLINELHEQALARLADVFPAAKTVVTTIDDRQLAAGESFRSPLSLSRNIGADSRALVALRSAHDFVVQIEDPFTAWSGPADRFARFPSLYPEVDPAALVIDVNVVERGTALDLGLTTKKAVGIELAEQLAAVGSTGARLALYASSTIRPDDLRWARFALAAGSVTMGPSSTDPTVLEVEATAAFRLRLTRPAHVVRIDGVPWALSEATVLVDVPAGSHRVSFG